mmetsp:Transcript_21428/g.44642  ORF Transcript_21428/g.44642 Transcript_21428/m.44642 type:complete len:380 (-) Transcript_21428:253-1392(-)
MTILFPVPVFTGWAKFHFPCWYILAYSPCLRFSPSTSSLPNPPFLPTLGLLNTSLFLASSKRFVMGAPPPMSSIIAFTRKALSSFNLFSFFLCSSSSVHLLLSVASLTSVTPAAFSLSLSSFTLLSAASVSFFAFCVDSLGALSLAIFSVNVSHLFSRYLFLWASWLLVLWISRSCLLKSSLTISAPLSLFFIIELVVLCCNFGFEGGGVLEEAFLASTGADLLPPPPPPPSLLKLPLLPPPPVLTLPALLLPPTLLGGFGGGGGLTLVEDFTEGGLGGGFFAPVEGGGGFGFCFPLSLVTIPFFAALAPLRALPEEPGGLGGAGGGGGFRPEALGGALGGAFGGALGLGFAIFLKSFPASLAPSLGGGEGLGFLPLSP